MGQGTNNRKRENIMIITYKINMGKNAKSSKKKNEVA